MTNLSSSSIANARASIPDHSRAVPSVSERYRAITPFHPSTRKSSRTRPEATRALLHLVTQVRGTIPSFPSITTYSRTIAPESRSGILTPSLPSLPSFF